MLSRVIRDLISRAKYPEDDVEIGPAALASSVFLARQEPNGRGGNYMQWVGTAFFIEIYSYRLSICWSYLVTCKHVADLLDVDGCRWYLFANRRDGSVGEWSYGTGGDAPHSHWYHHPDPDDDVDLAILPLAPPEDSEAWALPHTFLLERSELVLTEADLEKNRLHRKALQKADIEEYHVSLERVPRFFVGNELSMIGMFSEHRGSHRIKPILRRGTLSMVPDEGEQVVVSNDGSRSMEVFLIEARSTSGLSGSPVMIHQDGYPKGIGRLLGVARHHWDVHRGDRPPYLEEVNTGIASVVPAWKLRETLDQQVLASERAEGLKRAGRHVRNCDYSHLIQKPPG